MTVRAELADGRILEFPDGTDPGVIQATVKKLIATPTWGELPGNIPGSAKRFAGGLVQAVRHPIQTAGTVLDVAAGGLRAATPDPVRSVIDRALNPAAAERAGATASAVGDFYKARYGSPEGVKRTVITDPVGAAADLSTVLGVAGGVSRLGATAAGKAGLPTALPTAAAEVMRAGATATNPLSVIAPAVKGAGKATGIVGSAVGGLLTGAGPENIATAARSGFGGKKAFWQNLTGKVSKTDVLKQAHDALETMRIGRLSRYRSGITATAADTTPLDFKSIVAALDDVEDSLKAGRHWKIGRDEIGKLRELREVVSEWRNDPAMHTAIGLDALKQRIDSLYPDSPTHVQARRAITAVRTAVKDTIVKQSPAYAETMSTYEKAITLENEIKRALSLNDKASADTALRKLQSLARNNVQANYGFRMELAKALEEQGGQDLLPAISGQAMDTWISRGLPAQGADLAILAASLSNPKMLALLPFQSPKMMGAGLYGAGRLAGVVGRPLGALSRAIPLTQQERGMLGLYGAQAGLLGQ